MSKQVLDLVTNEPETLTIRVLARRYGREPRALERFLRKKGILMVKKVQFSARGHACWCLEGENITLAIQLLRETGHRLVKTPRKE